MPTLLSRSVCLSVCHSVSRKNVEDLTKPVLVRNYAFASIGHCNGRGSGGEGGVVEEEEEKKEKDE